MARSAHPSNGLQAYILILAMTTIVTVFSASTIHGGVRDFPLGLVRANAAPVAPARAVLFSASDTFRVDLKEGSARVSERVPTPLASERPTRERFIGEGAGRMHFKTPHSTVASNHSDTRVHLLEATALLRDRGGLQEQRDAVSRSTKVLTDN